MSDRVTTQSFRQAKLEGRKIVGITAYDAPSARLADGAGIDFVLVGDSVGNNVLGYEETLMVTLDDIVHHVKAVRRGLDRALLIADMPFLSYGVSVTDAVYNAGRLIQAGARAVKVESATEHIVESIKAMIDVGIPVMGHLGFTPQFIHQVGGSRVQGRTEDAVERLLEAAVKIEGIGAFAIVLELMPANVAERITGAVGIPTIGIGAGPHCDGQVQIINDILGLSTKAYKHSKAYADLHGVIADALSRYVNEVRDGEFPTDKQSF